MAPLFAALLVLHGLIHLLGTAKAFGWAALPQLTVPIAPVTGAVWLAASVLFLWAAVALFLQPRWWWLIAAVAVGLSTVVVAVSWTDARAGALLNVVVAVGALFGFLSQGPFSLRAEFEHDVASLLPGGAPTAPVTEADLAHLPPPVQRYLQGAGVVGAPRVHSYRVRLHGRIRDGRNGRWMPIAAEQYNVTDPPARLFYLNASMAGVPVQGYHRYVADAASMRVRAAAIVPVVSARGREMTRSETVTLLNDMCVMAPATLVERGVEWLAWSERSARARFRNAGHIVEADLIFDAAGELVDFVSDDRSIAGPGDAMTRARWSTPIGEYRQFGPARLPSTGEGRWRDAEGEYAYIELVIDEVEYNVQPR